MESRPKILWIDDSITYGCFGEPWTDDLITHDRFGEKELSEGDNRKDSVITEDQ